MGSSSLPAELGSGRAPDRLTDGAQRRLWPDWRHHAFLTDLDGTAADVDAFHRRHAEVELAIRDLKEGAGMEHVPSGHFSANGAWLCCAVLAHNLLRLSVTLGRQGRYDGEIRRTGPFISAVAGGEAAPGARVTRREFPKLMQ